jgi:hypothetical protein
VFRFAGPIWSIDLSSGTMTPPGSQTSRLYRTASPNPLGGNVPRFGGARRDKGATVVPDSSTYE